MSKIAQKQFAEARDFTVIDKFANALKNHMDQEGYFKYFSLNMDDPKIAIDEDTKETFEWSTRATLDDNAGVRVMMSVFFHALHVKIIIVGKEVANMQIDGLTEVDAVAPVHSFIQSALKKNYWKR